MHKTGGNLAIHLDYSINVLYIYTDRGRCIRPLIKVYHFKNFLKKINNLKTFNWNNLCIDNKYSIIEYIDIHEVNNTLQCVSFDKLKNKNYTHLEIDPSVILGIMANQVIFAENNPLPRDLFSCGQSKQGVSMYHSNFQNRIDKSSLILNYGQIPLIKSRYSLARILSLSVILKLLRDLNAIFL